MTEAKVMVDGIFKIEAVKGPERIVSCKIQEGRVDTDHSADQATSYDLVDQMGVIYRVIMAENYAVRRLPFSEKGTYLSFHFPLAAAWPAEGEVLSCRLSKSTH